MSVSPTSAANVSLLQTTQSSQQSIFAQRRQDFQNLAQALSSGDLAGAQSAFSALQQTFQSSNQNSSGQQTGSSIVNAFQALGQALSSNNLAAAQTAFATLQQDLQQAQGHRHHHQGAAGQVDTSAAGTATTTTPSTGGINVTA